MRDRETENKDVTQKTLTNGEVCNSDGCESSHLPRYVSGEVAVGGKLEVATVSSGVVHHIDLSGL